MENLFDFDPGLVETAMRGKDEEARRRAFEKLCTEAFGDYARLEAEIRRRAPGWPLEWLDRARDLFLHDRFIGLFADPPEEKIENINALCYKLLKDSIKDAYRFFTADMRSPAMEIHADAAVFGKDGASTFWEAHESEILASPAQAQAPANERVEMADLMRHVNAHLALMSPARRRVVRMWMNGFSEIEIAERFGLTTGNVGCIVSRTIKHLRKKLCKKS